jgi:molybdopterin synthase catalytic subunit
MESFFTSLPLDREALRRAVENDAAGALLVFEGVVRDHSEGRTGIVALEYEAKLPMADKLLTRILRETREEIPVLGIAMRHRVGRAELREPTVIIAVSAAHRDEAYRASRRVIDRVKHEAPIWKREIFADGTSEWSFGCTACNPGETAGEPAGHAHP